MPHLSDHKNFLRRGGWKDSGGHYYFPADHPHLHLGPGFMAYSWRGGWSGYEQRSIQMVQNGDLKNFTLGLDQIAKDYADNPDLKKRMIREAQEVAVVVFNYNDDYVWSL